MTVKNMFSVKLNSKENANLRIVWLHGWGTTHESMLIIADMFANITENYAVDLAGFGNSSELLDRVYSSKDYADDVADFIKTLPQKKTLIIGHSNGGRVAIQLAANYHNIVDGIGLLGGSGIPIKHGIFFKIYMFFVKKLSFIKKKTFLKNINIGSSDYRKTSGVKRETFKKLIDENLTEISRTIKIPTLLVYGGKDTASPLYIGKEYNKNIENSVLCTIPDANHYDLIIRQAKLVQHYIIKFIREKI
jgi:pimeloyl-ACP methyl ester carboxylesterase